MTTASTAAPAAALAGRYASHPKRCGCSSRASAAWRACVSRERVRPSRRFALSSRTSWVRFSNGVGSLIHAPSEYFAQTRAQGFQRAEIMRLHTAFRTTHRGCRLVDVEAFKIAQQERLLLAPRQFRHRGLEHADRLIEFEAFRGIRTTARRLRNRIVFVVVLGIAQRQPRHDPAAHGAT